MSHSQPSGVEQIAAERQRQVDREGWTPEHDDEHARGQLAQAAIVYALHACKRPISCMPTNGWTSVWPWEAQSWKPSSDKVRDLVKAGALIAAEIDRLERAR